MNNFHSLLKRQLKKYFNSGKFPDGKYKNFIEAVNKAYNEFDQDRYMLERSLDLSSEELLAANSALKIHQRELENIVKERTVELQNEIKERKKLYENQEALYEISNASQIVKNLGELLKRIREILSYSIDTSNFFIALYDKENNLITFPYFIDSKDDIKSAPADRSVTGYIIRQKIPMLLTSSQIKKLSKAGEFDLLGTVPKIWLGVPLMLEDEAIGALVVQSYSDANAYSMKDLDLLNFVSNQIARAIQSKRAEDAIKKYSNELEELNKNKDKFFSILAHDLKSPFNSLLGSADLLVNEIDDFSSEEIQYFAKGIQRSAKSVFNLLQNLLEWSRIQTGRIEYSPVKLNLNALATGVISLYKPVAEEKKIKIARSIPLDLFVTADEYMINTVLRNLISNAVKFSHLGKSIKVFAEREDEKIITSIYDTGKGIKPENINKLFTIGKQFTTLGTSNEKGTGMGLLLCKEFVKMNKGEIWVESKAGNFSKFSFSLPAAKV